MDKINDMIKDMRLFMTKYDKVISQLHKRVFLDKVTRDQISIYMSCYLSAPNRDAFMNYKQELFLGLLSVIKAHGAKLARNYLNVRIPSLFPPLFARVCVAGCADLLLCGDRVGLHPFSSQLDHVYSRL